jgi:hypothetical protein
MGLRCGSLRSSCLRHIVTVTSCAFGTAVTSDGAQSQATAIFLSPDIAAVQAALPVTCDYCTKGAICDCDEARRDEERSD